ncbi:MATE family efflux transporter [Alteromonas oceanisediminis]|uniref:MATE family efflux transporter n=1 Tax=Alteromonas oceanisediminis TaxID=2836180 RepID=UPI001BD9AA5F|nr:MATE family efflux transporter [Alteromonas oceanisediminis]MBT0586609.1 MATE family efflux transporter [Alteromonas oceanisediminis]
MASASRDLTDGSIWAAIANLTMPMVVGIVAVLSVSLVDTYFVGKLGTDELAALSFTFPITMAIASLASGLAAGAASVVSRAIGSKNQADAKRLSTDSLVLATVIVIAISAIGFFTIIPLFSLLGAQGDVLALLTRYMQIWYVSMPFLVIPMVANSIIRAVGDAFWPSLIMIGAAVINVIFTPLLIFGWGPFPALHIEGAAYSTLIARAATLFLALYIVLYREHMIDVSLPALKTLVQSWWKVLKIGVPAGAGSVVNPVGIAVVTALLATAGDTTVAAFGVATRIESFASIPMLALSAAIGPIAGQNWGAGNRSRVVEAVKKCYWVCAVWSVILAVSFVWLAAPLAEFLASEAQVAEQSTQYLMIVTVSLWGYGVVIVSSTAFNSLGKSVTGLAYYIVRTAIFYVPLSAIASIAFGSSAVFYAIATANALSGAIVGAYALHWLTRHANDAS